MKFDKAVKTILEGRGNIKDRVAYAKTADVQKDMIYEIVEEMFGKSKAKKIKKEILEMAEWILAYEPDVYDIYEQAKDLFTEKLKMSGEDADAAAESFSELAAEQELDFDDYSE